MIIFYSFMFITALLLIYMTKEAFSNRILFQEMEFNTLPKSFDQIRIFFISDIHRRSISEKIIDEVIGKVDIVIIGGDLTEKGVPFNRVVENINRLKKVAPVYFVWGNNDYEIDSHLLDATLLDMKVKILDNTTVTFESKTGEAFVLIGIDDVTTHRDRLDLAIADCKQEGFRLLVSHNPAITSKIGSEHNIDFILSGHTHGGQIRIFGIGPYQKGGIRRLDHTTILTSNGYGTTGLPFRLGVKSETHVLTIKHGNSKLVDSFIKIIS